jgi:membrane associated rhomboid family serine protease
MHRGGRRLPVLTITATSVALAAACGQYLVPGMVSALQREPGGLPAGQWWRLVTPLLVQTLGWYQVVANLVTLALFGVLAERLLGRWRWVTLFAGGTLGGEAAAYAWHDPGGGDSIAICGLAAGVTVTLLTRREPPPRFAAAAVACYVAALAGWGFVGVRAAALACVLAAISLIGLWLAQVRGAERAALAGTVACAPVMAAHQDLHGASLTSGMLLMGALLLGALLLGARGRADVPAARHGAPRDSAVSGGLPGRGSGRS